MECMKLIDKIKKTFNFIFGISLFIFNQNFLMEKKKESIKDSEIKPFVIPFNESVPPTVKEKQKEREEQEISLPVTFLPYNFLKIINNFQKNISNYVTHSTEATKNYFEEIKKKNEEIAKQKEQERIKEIEQKERELNKEKIKKEEEYRLKSWHSANLHNRFYWNHVPDLVRTNKKMFLLSLSLVVSSAYLLGRSASRTVQSKNILGENLGSNWNPFNLPGKLIKNIIPEKYIIANFIGKINNISNSVNIIRKISFKEIINFIHIIINFINNMNNNAILHNNLFVNINRIIPNSINNLNENILIDNSIINIINSIINATDAINNQNNNDNNNQNININTIINSTNININNNDNNIILINNINKMIENNKGIPNNNINNIIIIINSIIHILNNNSINNIENISFNLDINSKSNYDINKIIIKKMICFIELISYILSSIISLEEKKKLLFLINGSLPLIFLQRKLNEN